MTDSARGALDVAMFTPWHARCGIRDYTANLVEALDGLPEIASTRIVPSPPDAVRSGLLDLFRNYWIDARRYRSLGQAMNAGADIAHVQHQYFLVGGVAPHKTHVRAFLDALAIPTVLTVHEIAEPGPGYLSGWAVRTANRLNFLHRAVKGLIVHTEADRQRLVGAGAPDARIHLIRHAVPPALPMPDRVVARAAWEREYPVLKGRRVVTVFGFLSFKKGHTNALMALLDLPDDVALVFAGGQHPDDHTEYVAGLRTIMSYFPPASRAVITGYVPPERVPEIMAITDVALAPFLRSSGSGSLANLLAYGRAIVASDIEPHRELLAEEPGLLALFPSEPSGGLAAEVNAVLNDASRRERLQQAALAYAAGHTYVKMARESVRVYREILDRPVPSAR
jgi:glycosyltransferase involved in cell wall biosynthesis